MLSTSVPSPYAVIPTELWPLPDSRVPLVATTARRMGSKAMLGCEDGANAADCLLPVSDDMPLDVGTSRTDSATLPFALFSLAPVLPSGWVLLGEADKIVPVSPQRFVVADPSKTPRARSACSDALAAEELHGEPGGGLSFRVLGGPGEHVSVRVVQPDTRQAERLSRALGGVIRVLDVEVSAEGIADVNCRSVGCEVRKVNKEPQTYV